jgi:hypothetical protein
MPTSDPVRSIPIRQSTLRVLREMKTDAETWDEFLMSVTDDYLSPAHRAELDRKLRADAFVPGSQARQTFRARRKRA